MGGHRKARNRIRLFFEYEVIMIISIRQAAVDRLVAEVVSVCRSESCTPGVFLKRPEDTSHG